jgi:PAS domain S-box-containing protein
MNNQTSKVLLLTEKPKDARLIREMLTGTSGTPFEVEWVRNPSQVTIPPGLEKWDAILLDWDPAGSQGWNALSKVRKEFPATAIVILTGKADEEPALKAIRSGAQDFLSKREMDSRLLIRSLRYAIERKRLESKIQDDLSCRKSPENSHLEAAVEQLADGVIITDGQGRILYANPAFSTFFETTPQAILGRRYHELWENHRKKEFEAAFREGTTWKGRVTQRRKNGNSRDVDVVITPLRDEKNGSAVNFVVIEKDVTDEVQIQWHLRHMQKMQGLEKLAGGIAHDFNTLLSTIVINTEMALFDRENSTAQRCLPLVLQAAERGKELVKQIVAFSRLREQPRKPTRVSPVLQESLRFLRSSLPKNIEIREDLVTLSDVVLADPSQIHQILLNLCANAADAMREEGGLLEVKLNVVDMDPGVLATRPDLPPGSYLRLTVRDTGEGMPPEIMERIFDPFFTTKKTGEGSGMGLAVVHGLVESYGGAVDVYSQVGLGSTFHVYFPRVEDNPEPGNLFPEDLTGKKERILLVDDEETQLFSMQSMLKRMDYRVTARRSSLDALSDFEKDPNGFDLVITDQTMPGMTGIRLAQALLKIRPEIPIILCTGYSEVVNLEEAKAKGVREFMLKPFSTGEMAEAIRRILRYPREK